MGAPFTLRANIIMATALAAVACVVMGVGTLWFAWPYSDYDRHVGWVVEQPVPFSHQHHVAGLGLDCRFCHSSVERGAQASLPPTFTCMTCHSQVWTNAPVLTTVRDSLLRNIPMTWQRVTNVPDYVYFNHGIHVAKGVGCESCHGNVATMPLTYKAKTLTMQFCLDCHRDPAPNLRPAENIFDMDWRRAPDTPAPAVLMARYHLGGRNLTDCSICHR